MAKEENVIGGRYRLLAQIGAGGMSKVYLALDSSLSKQWAVKEILNVTDSAKRDVVVKSLLVEANMIKKLDHPAIPRIVDLVEDDSRLFVVMDYVEGRTLQSILDTEGPQDEELVTDWGIQLCDVLDYLHRRKPPVIFRDMKPSNVMLKPDGTIKIIDFGIAREVGAADPSQELIGDVRNLGTQGYAAPEQYANGAAVDARTDVYSLGVTLFALLTGADPRHDAIVPIRQLVPSLSVGLEKIITKATRENPDERYRDCAEMAYDLENYTVKDDESRKGLRRKWDIFLAACIAGASCLVLSGSALGASAAVLNSDFNHWVQLGDQATSVKAAESDYTRAMSLNSSSTVPYEKLIQRYTADGVFSTSEERVYNSAISQYTQDLMKNSNTWANLSFETGKLYWYYYSGDDQGNGQSAVESSTAARYQDNVSIRYARVRAAEPWMKNAADVSSFPQRKLAQMYSDIAQFNTRIVPLINEGSDTGVYKPYFGKLEQLLKMADSETNDVMKLESSNLILDAVRTYPRKFRADGISEKQMTDLIAGTNAMAGQVTPTTKKLDVEKQESTDSVSLARTEVQNAFVDIKGDKK